MAAQEVDEGRSVMASHVDYSSVWMLAGGMAASFFCSCAFCAAFGDFNYVRWTKLEEQSSVAGVVGTCGTHSVDSSVGWQARF